MIAIVIAAAALGAMGLLFGGALSVIGKKFAIPQNEKQTEVRNALPGANCGACGYPGCDAYAEAVVLEGADITKCPVGGVEVVKNLGEIMGIQAEARERMVATVMCRGDISRCSVRFNYQGHSDCRNAALAAQGDKACPHSCLGLGNCEITCPFGAISVNEDRLAEVDEAKCVGCGLCVDGCPRGILKLLPVKSPVNRMCSAMDKGRIVRDSCTAGCLGCGKCAKSCKFGAVQIVNHLPEINLEKCVGCMQCADNCPTGAIHSNEKLRKRAIINYKECISCDRCVKKCEFDAINHNEKGRYSVISWNCTGCGQCVDQCPKKCIYLAPGVKFG